MRSVVYRLSIIPCSQEKCLNDQGSIESDQMIYLPLQIKMRTRLVQVLYRLLEDGIQLKDVQVDPVQGIKYLWLMNQAGVGKNSYPGIGKEAVAYSQGILNNQIKPGMHGGFSVAGESYGV